ncbi:hypothetical protein [Hymenobacter sp. B81]|uniref:hypothetical protein n=1 Tax=Hymenobacter sp. B81 TaxID=3344878 RepID=UPI0037DD43CB
MRFRFMPLEKRDGAWQVNFLPLAICVSLLNLLFMALVYWWPESSSVKLRRVPARAMKHPVVVISQSAALREAADDAAKQLKTLHKGDTVDLYVAQPDGWYFITSPNPQPATYALPGYNGGVAGYLRHQDLQVPDSTLLNINRQQ